MTNTLRLTRFTGAKDNRGESVSTTWEAWRDELRRGITPKEAMPKPEKKPLQYRWWKTRLAAWSPAVFVPVVSTELLTPLRERIKSAQRAVEAAARALEIVNEDERDKAEKRLATAEDERDKAEARLHTAEDGGRCLEAVREQGGAVTALVVESDGDERIERALELWQGTRSILHTSTAHTESIHRFRLVLALSREITAAEHAVMLRWAKDRHGHGVMAETEKDACRMWYMPIAGCRIEILEGEPIDVDDVLLRQYNSGSRRDPDADSGIGTSTSSADAHQVASNRGVRPNQTTEGRIGIRTGERELTNGQAQHQEAASSSIRPPVSKRATHASELGPVLDTGSSEGIISPSLAGPNGVDDRHNRANGQRRTRPTQNRLARARLYAAKIDPATESTSSASLNAAGKLRTCIDGLTQDECLDALMAEWAHRCTPPRATEYMRRKVAEAYRLSHFDYDPSKEKSNGQTINKKTKASIRQERVPAIRADAVRDVDEDDSESSANNRLEFLPSFARGDHAELADALFEVLGPDPITHDLGQFWRYEQARGVWAPLASAVVRSTLHAFAGAPVGTRGKTLHVFDSTARGVESRLIDRILSDPEHVTFNNARHGIVFRNGFLTVQDGIVILRPHHEANGARCSYPFDYEPYDYASTPLLNEFFERLWSDLSEAERASRIALVQEFVGACLLGEATRYQRCFVLCGEGGQGKSALLTIIKSVFHDSAVASLPPQMWREFELCGLEGKLINLVDELPSTEIMSTEYYKHVIAGDVPLTARRKRRDAIVFTPRAGHIFSANEDSLPTRDHSRGFWRRNIIIKLTRYLDALPDGERVLKAGERVVEAEIERLPAWAIEGAVRLQLRGDYAISEQVHQDTADVRINSDPALMFLASWAPEGDRVDVDALYTRYRNWCRDNGFQPVSSQKFRRRVTASGIYTRERSGFDRYYVRVTH